jgi:Mg-chelatase subunit ChlD
MKMREIRIGYIGSKIAFVILVVFVMANHVWAVNYDHNLVMQPAFNITSPINGGNWKSPDLKIGTDFENTSMPDIIQRGVSNSIYARFTINGVEDQTVPSGGAEIRFHYRVASVGVPPPALSDPSWTSIGTLSVTYNVVSDGLFAISRTWPTDFPSVTTKSVSWLAPQSGNHFHIRAEVVYTTGVTDENPVDNVAISLYESRAGLANIVLLHDASGSMGMYKCDGSTYMELAKSKASAFVLSSLREADRLAVVAFSSDYIGYTTVIWPPSATLELASWANKVSASAAITGLSAGGPAAMTPMGAGLQRATQILTASPDPDRKSVIILLSDGYENWGMPRACDDTAPADPNTCVGGSVLAQLLADNIRVYSTALGTAAWTEGLECLADQSGGQWYSTPCPGIDLSEIYLHIGQGYSTDDLYSVSRGVTGDGGDTYSTYFEGVVDDILYFVLSWNALGARLDLQLRPPGLSWISPEGLSNSSVSRGKGYAVVRVEKPAEGTWEYRVTGDDGKEYLVAVRSDRAGVRLEMDVTSEGKVGELIRIRARLTDGEKPIEDANLAATVQVPVNASLETKLRKESRNYIMEHKASPVDPSVLEENPDISPRAAFIHRITDDERETLMETRSITIALQHEGKGVYSGVLKDNTTIAGAYKVTVECSEERFHRTQSRQLRLRPGEIVPENSFAEILEIEPEGKEPIWLLKLYATDKFGNAITDPSLIDQIRAEVKGAELVGEPGVAFDSTFQQQLSVLPGQKPELQMMKIGDKEVKVIKEDSGKPWWKYGIGAFLALLLGFLIGLATQS